MFFNVQMTSQLSNTSIQTSISITGVRKMLVAQLCPTLCDPMDFIAYQVPLSIEFSKREYWSGLSFPSPGDLPDPRIKPGSPALQADSLPSEPPSG